MKSLPIEETCVVIQLAWFKDHSLNSSRYNQLYRFCVVVFESYTFYLLATNVYAIPTSVFSCPPPPPTQCQYIYFAKAF